jgi:hypothetical protein
MLGASPDKITRLRSISNEGPPFRIERACAQCKLYSLAGDHQEARRILSDWQNKIRGDKDSKEKAHLLAISAILVGELDLARQLIADHIQPKLDFGLAVDDASPSPSPGVRWTVTLDHQSRFVLNSAIPRSDNGELYIARWLHTLPLFARVCSDQIQGGVNLSLEDHGVQNGLAYCDNRPGIFLIPDPPFIRTSGYAGVRSFFAHNDLPWDVRRPIAFWRGSTSGRPEPRELGWRALPRVRLCEISRRHPELIDAALTEIVQITDGQSRDEIASSGLMARRSPVTEIGRYRYQIDIDGNSNSWPGLFQKLLSGSTVLKVSSPYGYRQWYYDRLKPWVHFVPIASDLSDLVEKVEWVRDNDKQAREIGQRGRELAFSMDIQAELQHAVGVVAAAFRESMNLPELSLSFGAHAAGNSYLGTGWAVEEDGSAWSVGRASSIEIPAPASRGDYTIEFEISPCATTPVAVTIAINGESGRPHTIDSRQTIRRPLPLSAGSSEEPVSIILLNRTVHPAACASRPLDDRLVGARLHAISFRKCSELASSRRRLRAAPAEHRKSRQAAVMRAIHGEDIWRYFSPSGPPQEAVQGWNGLYSPFKHFLLHAPNQVFVDVGVWKGQATIFVAELMQASAMDGCVVAVDTFLGYAEHLAAKQELFKRFHGRPDLYETFLDNVYYRRLTHLVVPLPQTSVTAAKLLGRCGIMAGVVHLDASREYEDVLRDAEVYWPLIESGGYLIGDDYHETWPGVVRAAQEFATAKNLELTVHMPKWVVRKP